MAAGAVIYFQNQFRHQAVIPSQSLGIHECPEVIILSVGQIGLIQHIC